MEWKVKECWVEGKWKLPQLSMEVPSHIFDRVECIVWKLSEAEDRPCSTLAEDNLFSLRKAFERDVKNRGLGRKNQSWEWEGDFPPKIRFFLWLIWYGKIPTKIFSLL